jgi:predicted ATPase
MAVGERLRDRFDAGTVFVALGEVTEPALVLARLAGRSGSTWGAPARRGRLSSSSSAMTGGCSSSTNLEQVLAAARDLDELVVRCPGVVILATSRTTLRLRAEQEYPVAPLPFPADPATAAVDLAASPAVALFVDRTRAVRYDFGLTDGNAPAVAEICRRLEGLPLAIELAAARTRLLDPDALLRRLARSLDALGDGGRCHARAPAHSAGHRRVGAWSCSTTPSARCWRPRPSSSTAGPSRPPPKSRASTSAGRST